MGKRPKGKQTILSCSPDKTVPYDSYERIDPISPHPPLDQDRVIAVCLSGVFLRMKYQTERS